MIIITACIYFLLLALMFFIEVPEALVIVVGAGVIVSLTLYRLRGEGRRNEGDFIWSFAKNACIAALILIALGVMQSLLVGKDTTDVLGHRVWKLYCVLSIFVIDALSTSGHERRKMSAGKETKGDSDGNHHRE